MGPCPRAAVIHPVRGCPTVVMVLALLPELADPGVLTALPPVDRLVAAGPGWDGVDLSEGIERVGDLPGALRIVEEAFQPGDPGTKGRRRSVSRR